MAPDEVLSVRECQEEQSQWEPHPTLTLHLQYGPQEVRKDLITSTCGPWIDYDVVDVSSLCQKDSAQGTQSLLLGEFLAFRWFFMA